MGATPEGANEKLLVSNLVRSLILAFRYRIVDVSSCASPYCQLCPAAISTSLYLKANMTKLYLRVGGQDTSWISVLSSSVCETRPLQKSVSQ